MKKLYSVLICFGLVFALLPATANASFSDLGSVSWAESAINSLADKGILNGMGNNKYEPSRNVTRGQFACIIVRAFGLTKNVGVDFPDVPTNSYYHDDILTAREAGVIAGRDDGKFYPDESVSRQDMFLMTARATNDTSAKGELSFNDTEKISSYAREGIQKLRNYILGDDKNNIRPKDTANRAEVAVFIDRVLNKTYIPSPPPSPTPLTSGVAIRGAAQASVGQAKDWARKNGASQKFIDAADYYWNYATMIDIRPEVLYAQSAKETNFGKFTGVVTPDMNNWAGIKTAAATGDLKDDHETFASSENGVRGHFNHMAAYIGAEPIGVTHARYAIVKSASWAGSVRFVEELSGKWAPSSDYGSDLISNFLNPLLSFKYVPVDKSKKIVYLSPSNQIHNAYAYGNTNEGEQMNLLAPMIKAELEKMGFEVIVAKREDTFQQRAENAYNAGAFAYVALHTNAANKLAIGTEVWYQGGNTLSKSLAQSVYDKVAPLYLSTDRGLKDGLAQGLAELRLPMTPNCLVEIEFHDVAPVAEWIINNKPRIAVAVAEAINEFWGR